MNEPKSQQEPSMEEILASIRRIISEEDAPEPLRATQEAASPDNVDDVLELTEIAEDPEPEVPETIAAEPEEAEPEEEPEPVAEALEEIDLEELEVEPEIPAEELEFREMEDEAEEPEEEPPAPEPVFEPSRPMVEESALLGAQPAATATGSLASLVEAVDRAHGGTPLGDGNRTIEDLVKEVMRPMIREWLDNNLPGLVDRLVRREIERLSRSAEGDY